MSYYSNPTANRAQGAVDRLIRQMTKRAKMYGAIARAGRLSDQAKARIRREFVGLYRPLLPVALGEKTYEEVFPDVA
jgi:hypothetical protein